MFWRALARALVATTLLWIVLSVPLPLTTPRFVVMVETPLLVFLFMLYLGKVLYDTFFYDRYH